MCRYSTSSLFPSPCRYLRYASTAVCVIMWRTGSEHWSSWKIPFYFIFSIFNSNQALALVAALLHKQWCQHKAGGGSRTAWNRLSNLSSAVISSDCSQSPLGQWKGYLSMMMMVAFTFCFSLVPPVVLTGPDHATETVQRTVSAENWWNYQKIKH